MKVRYDKEKDVLLIIPEADEDTDILQMVSAGLNESADVMTGTPSGPYSSVKATRGPMTDRISDEIAYFDRYLKYDFWSAIFFIRSKLAKSIGK